MKIQLTSYISALILATSLPAFSQTTLEGLPELTDADCAKLHQPKTAVYVYNSLAAEPSSASIEGVLNDPALADWTFYKKPTPAYTPMALMTVISHPWEDYINLCGEKIYNVDPHFILPTVLSESESQAFLNAK